MFKRYFFSASSSVAWLFTLSMLASVDGMASSKGPSLGDRILDQSVVDVSAPVLSTLKRIDHEYVLKDRRFQADILGPLMITVLPVTWGGVGTAIVTGYGLTAATIIKETLLPDMAKQEIEEYDRSGLVGPLLMNAYDFAVEQDPSLSFDMAVQNLSLHLAEILD